MTIVNVRKTVDVSIEKVFEAFTSYESFQKKLPKMFPSVVIKSRRGDVFVTEEHRIFMGKEIIILAKHVLKPPESHRTVFLGGNFKGTRISEDFSHKDGKTTIKVEINLRQNILYKMFGINSSDRLRKEAETYADNLLSLVY